MHVNVYLGTLIKTSNYIYLHQQKNWLHCKLLQGFTGCLQGFPAISMENGYTNHRETLYSSKGKIVYVVGKPCNIYRLRGNPIIIIGFSLQTPRKPL